MGPGLELLTAVMRRYQQITGRHLSADRFKARHLRTALGEPWFDNHRRLRELITELEVLSLAGTDHADRV
jgi:hypothetical protein